MVAYRLNFSYEERQRHVGSGVRKSTRTETQFTNAPVERKGNRQPSLAVEIGRHGRFREKSKADAPIRHHDHVTGAEEGGVRPSVRIYRGKPQGLRFRQQFIAIEIARHSVRNFTTRRWARVGVFGLFHFSPP